MCIVISSISHKRAPEKLWHIDTFVLHVIASNEDFSSKHIPSPFLQSQETVVNPLTGSYSQMASTVHIFPLDVNAVKIKEQAQMWLMPKWMNLASQGALTTIVSYLLSVLWSCLGQLFSVWKWIFLHEDYSVKLYYKWHRLVQLLWFFGGKSKAMFTTAKSCWKYLLQDVTTHHCL